MWVTHTLVIDLPLNKCIEDEVQLVLHDPDPGTHNTKLEGHSDRRVRGDVC
jgi:hypothetical protein